MAPKPGKALPDAAPAPEARDGGAPALRPGDPGWTGFPDTAGSGTGWWKSG